MGGGGLFTGTLNMLVLLALGDGPLHGYAIGRWIRQTSKGGLGVAEGQLYPALHRMAERGWLKEGWGKTDTGRRARFYELTVAGRQRLAEEQDNWRQYTDAVHHVMAARD
jgi:transcriptional regulator